MPQRAGKLNLGQAAQGFANAARLIAEAGRSEGAGEAAKAAGIAGGVHRAVAGIEHAQDRRSREKMEADRLAQMKELEGLRLGLAQGRLDLSKQIHLKELEHRAKQDEVRSLTSNMSHFYKMMDRHDKKVQELSRHGPIAPEVREKLAGQYATIVNGLNANATALWGPEAAQMSPDMLLKMREPVEEMEVNNAGGVEGAVGAVVTAREQLREARDRDDPPYVINKMIRALSDAESALVSAKKGIEKRVGMIREAKAQKERMKKGREEMASSRVRLTNLLANHGQKPTAEQLKNVRIAIKAAVGRGSDPRVAADNMIASFLPEEEKPPKPPKPPKPTPKQKAWLTFEERQELLRLEGPQRKREANAKISRILREEGLDPDDPDDAKDVGIIVNEIMAEMKVDA